MKKNIQKAFLLLLSGALLFVVLISVFPVIGSFILPDFSLAKVLKENFSLLISLFCVSVFLAPILGFFSTLLRKNRFLWLLITGVFLY